jgi:hypothetical protein
MRRYLIFQECSEKTKEFFYTNLYFHDFCLLFLFSVAKSTNNGELAAFITYALAYPKGTLCLVDTYDTLGSGMYNFGCCLFFFFFSHFDGQNFS